MNTISISEWKRQRRAAGKSDRTDYPGEARQELDAAIERGEVISGHGAKPLGSRGTAARMAEWENEIEDCGGDEDQAARNLGYAE